MTYSWNFQVMLLINNMFRQLMLGLLFIDWNFQVMLLINNIFKQFVHRLTFRRCKMKKITFSPRHGAVDVLELSHLLMLHDG